MHTDAQQQVHRPIPYIQSLRLWTVPVRGWQDAGPCCCFEIICQAEELYLRETLLLHWVEFILQAALCMLATQKEFSFCCRMCRYMLYAC